MNMLLDFIITAIPLGMTFLFGCVGEILTEKAGHLNLGIPGIMCVGGTCGCVALKMLRNSGLPWPLIVVLAILAAFVGGMLMGLIYSFLTVTLRANQNVTGLAMTTFGVGVTKFVMSPMAEGGGMSYLYALKYFRYPFQGRTDALKYCGIMVFLGIIIALVAAFVLSKTRSGLYLRAVGENPATADAVGINVTGYKYRATLIGSGVAALGGLFYIMDYAGSYEAYKSIEAMGWLSVALVIFTLWKPALSILGSFLFGLLYIAGSRIPTLLGIQLDMSATPLLQMLPYLVTIVVLIVVSVRKKREHQPPAWLGLPYFREDR
ncbi:MAG: ABC transporter permease [Clostridia bacterium]|nr:ABC transporter permease [Clostridia bacterium]MBQ2256843.1 ABC transporter permease [Clostridia bacterium]MBQ5794096.1 ABC transporter permease [Clostridia bacterium]